MLRIKKLNCKVSHKRIDHLLLAIRKRNVVDAKLILLISKTKYAAELLKLIVSLDNDYIITKSYSTIGKRKNKLISLSHGSFTRQSSRRCHVFFELEKQQ